MNNFLEHVPVLLNEILENLNTFKITNGVIIDATFGLGGYSNAILENTNCDVYGFDRDPEVLNYANKFLLLNQISNHTLQELLQFLLP